MGVQGVFVIRQRWTWPAWKPALLTTKVVPRSIGGVGYPSIHLQENDSGPDDCNHAQFGSFILAAPGVALHGELTGAHLLNVAPTLLEAGGYDIPSSMQGKSLLSGGVTKPVEPGFAPDQERVVRDRLSGLGYV